MRDWLEKKIWWHRIRGHKPKTEIHILHEPGKYVVCSNCKLTWTVWAVGSPHQTILRRDQ